MKIAIAGFGLEGRSSYNYYRAQGGHDITIADEADTLADIPSDAPTILGKDAFAKLQEFDLVLRSPPVNPARIVTSGKIWSVTNEFFANCPADIIGVTGSKGKGTTCSLIASILQASGRKVHLLGNIGTPALDVLPFVGPDDIVVYELSSFQLWDLERSPHVAVLIHLEADHLDVHKDMDEYLRAKANIRTHQTIDDICFYHPTNPYAQQIIDMQGDWPQNDAQRRDWKWRAFRYGTPEIRDESIAMSYIKDRTFCIKRPDEERISAIPTSILKILGEHNQQNACAAIDAALVYEVSDDAIIKGLSAFEGLPHRLQFVREVEGIRYYDDSFATTPTSSMVAMKAFDQPKVVILGGSSKGADFSELANVVASSNVRAAILIGDEADRIETALKEKNVVTFNIGKSVTMKEILEVVRAQTKTGDVVLLSPGCASFGMFKNYYDRADQFTAAVNALQ